LAPGTRIAGFTIEGLLASGSFGTVYRARRDERPFAIKLVPWEPRGDREVDALRRVRHPNVVGFHGYGLWPDEEPRFLVLALELVEGRTLEVWDREENPTALELVSQVLRPLADTLAAVHAEGVVHRDVKEANIVMREADGQPVLVDFGAAAYEGAPRLTMRLPPGTPEYRSPEALRFAREWEGEPSPARPGDDLWALGVTTYWLLTRTLPFGDRNDLGMVQAILHQAPEPPHERNPRVPRALGELCLRMLEKAPEARYVDAQALAEALVELESVADDSWRAPLFPGDRKQKNPAPPATEPKARAHAWTKWWPWVAIMGVVVGLFFLPASPRHAPVEDAPSIPRDASPSPPPPRQDSIGQEMAPAGLTGEVVSGAEPEKSPTPAPVASATHSEEVPMLKSPKLRALAAAGTACVGAACASGPQQRPLPGPSECPPGAVELEHRLRMVSYHEYDAYFPPFRKIGLVQVREGDITIETSDPLGDLPRFTLISGRLYFGKDSVHGRFTQARLPTGEVLPMCLQLGAPHHELGVPMGPGSTPDKVLIYSPAYVQPVVRFEHARSGG
jgi:serine/threonine-protein kinase